MNRILLLAVTACSLAACFQPEDESGKNGLQQGSPGGGAGGGTGGGTAQTTQTSGPDTLCASSITLINPGDKAVATGTCVCTRRDVVPAGTCPRGQNESVSATIGPAGGTLFLAGRNGLAAGASFTLTFPPNAIATDTVITVTETNLVPPTGIVDYSPIYRIEPVDLVLKEAAVLKVPWSNGRGGGTIDPDLALYWTKTDACGLEKLPSSYINAGFMNANVGRLGYAMVAHWELGVADYCK